MNPRPPILLDVESRSRADLKAIGGRLYWQHPSSEVLCIVWYDTENGEWGSWGPGMIAPSWVITGDRDIAAHNMMGFDRFALDRIGWRYRSLIDTAQLARRAGLPGSLDALGKRWLGRDKDKEGNRFTVGLSTCRRPTAKTAHLAPGGKAISPEAWRVLSAAERREQGALCEITPEMSRRVLEYCKSDVEIMVHGWPMLEPWATVECVGDQELELQDVERTINDRGVPFDRALALRLLEEDAKNQEDALAEIAAKLECEVDELRSAVSSPAQFCELTGASDAQKLTVEDLAKRDDEVGLIAQARQALASISRGKLEAGLRLAIEGPTGWRLYDVHQYLGASTGRWAGRGMQLQNMPRGLEGVDVEAEAARVLAGGRANSDLVSTLIRSVIRSEYE